MLYPIVLELEGRDVLVVGAGNVAERKIRRLLEARARVRVISRDASTTIERWGHEGRVALTLAEFDPAAMGQPALVFAATSEPATNDAVVAAARDRHVLANSAAGTDLDFVVPAVHRDEGLGVAVWSGSPALSRRLRDELVGLFDARWRLAGRVFETLRITLEGRGDPTVRGTFWRNLAAGAPQEFRTVAVARRFVRAVAQGAGLPLGKAESDALFEVADE